MRTVARDEEKIVKLLTSMRVLVSAMALAFPLAVHGQSGNIQSTSVGDFGGTTAPASNHCIRDNTGLVQNKVAILQDTTRTLHRLGFEPIPKTLSNRETQEASKFSIWLREASAEVGRLLAQGERFLQICEQIAASNHSLGRDEETRQLIALFSLEYLLLQQKLQREAREFNLLSKIMKARRVATTNAINNIR